MRQKPLPIILRHGEAKHVEVTKYPDGQHNVKLDLNYFNNPKYEVEITCSIRNWEELEILMCLVMALRQADYLIHQIKFAYLFGLRSDRLFEEGSCNYMQHVLSPVLNYLSDFANHGITILQPHGRSKKYLRNSRNSYYHKLPDFSYMEKIAGDESAIDILGQMFGFGIPEDETLSFIKRRQNGEIHVTMTTEDLNIIAKSEKPILIVDDLCDAGGTFIAEAKYLRANFPDRKLYLFIYHGLFTMGIDVVADHFDKIYCTNSYQDFEHPKVKQIKVI